MRWIGCIAALCLYGLPSNAAPARHGTPFLTADGWGALRVGMSEGEAARRFRLRVEQADGEDCHVLFSRDEHLMVMTSQGRVTSVTVLGDSSIRTDRGLHIGSREANVRRRYGRDLDIQPNAYDDPPAHYLTWWAEPGKRGIMFETDASGRVTEIHAGDETIGWTDGCG